MDKDFFLEFEYTEQDFFMILKFAPGSPNTTCRRYKKLVQLCRVQDIFPDLF